MSPGRSPPDDLGGHRGSFTAAAAVIADVHHDRPVNGRGVLLRDLHHLLTDGLDHRGDGPDLDAKDYIAIRAHDLLDRRFVKVIHGAELRHPRLAAVGEAEEVQNSRPVRRQHVSAHPQEGVRSDASAIDERRDALKHAGTVRVDAVPRDAVADVRVQVDEARRHDVALGVDHPHPVRQWDVFLDGGYHASVDPDVELPCRPGPGVDNSTALNQHIVEVHRPNPPRG